MRSSRSRARSVVDTNACSAVRSFRPLHVRDPKDELILATALGGRADFLVSGDDDLVVLRDEPKLKERLKIVTATEFLALVLSEQTVTAIVFRPVAPLAWSVVGDRGLGVRGRKSIGGRRARPPASPICRLAALRGWPAWWKRSYRWKSLPTAPIRPRLPRAGRRSRFCGGDSRRRRDAGEERSIAKVAVRRVDERAGAREFAVWTPSVSREKLLLLPRY